jgi:hypothetical protein
MPRTRTDAKNRGDFDINALKLVLEKPLSDANELQAGFRADLMWGEDAEAFGQDVVGSDSTFLEQAYVQFRLPYGNGIDFKVGKFVTILGYEVIERPVNLNITYGNIFTNMIPLWHIGALVSYQVDDMFDLQFGVVNGWNNDNSFGGGAATGAAARADAEDNAAIVASMNLTVPGGNANWYSAVYYGINGDGTRDALFDDAPLVVYDTWINWVPEDLDDKLLLGFNANIGTGAVSTNLPGLADVNGIASNGNPDHTTAWGAAFYGKYQCTDIFSIATRFDYIHNCDSFVFGNDAGASADERNEDIWSFTLTGSFDVIENMMLRTEYRLDWGTDLTNNATANADDGTSSCGPIHTAAVQVVYTF